MMVKLRCYLRTVLLIAIGLSWFSGAMADLNDGLVAYYPFDGNALDSSANNNHGSILGGEFDNGKFNLAYRGLDGRSVISIPDNDSLHLTEFSISTWIEVDSLNSSNLPIVWKGVKGTNITSPYSLFVTGNFSPQTFSSGATVSGSQDPQKIIVMISNGVSEQALFSDLHIPIGNFAHVVVTANGSTLKIYINGVLDSEVNQVIPLFKSNNPIQIGGLAQVGNNYFNGLIDELRIYNKALSESEIQQLYQMNNQPSDNCWATYENGNLHIPCIKVKGPFDDDLHYEADMQYEPLSEPMTFQVTGAKQK